MRHLVGSRWSRPLTLGGSTRDDLDGGTEGLRNYRSLLRGQAPVMHGSPDAETECTLLVATIEAWHANGINHDDIAVGAWTPLSLVDTRNR